MSRAEFCLSPEELEILTKVALHPKKGRARPLGLNVDHKGKRCEGWKADYSIAKRPASTASCHVHLSEKARKAAHPFLALKEAYVHATSRPADVVLTSPAHIEGRQDPEQREKVLKVIDGLIAKAGGAGSVSSSSVSAPAPAAAASAPSSASSSASAHQPAPPATAVPTGPGGRKRKAEPGQPPSGEAVPINAKEGAVETASASAGTAASVPSEPLAGPKPSGPTVGKRKALPDQQAGSDQGSSKARRRHSSSRTVNTPISASDEMELQKQKQEALLAARPQKSVHSNTRSMKTEAEAEFMDFCYQKILVCEHAVTPQCDDAKWKLALEGLKQMSLSKSVICNGYEMNTDYQDRSRTLFIVQESNYKDTVVDMACQSTLGVIKRRLNMTQPSNGRAALCTQPNNARQGSHFDFNRDRLLKFNMRGATVMFNPSPTPAKLLFSQRTSATIYGRTGVPQAGYTASGIQVEVTVPPMGCVIFDSDMWHCGTSYTTPHLRCHYYLLQAPRNPDGTWGTIPTMVSFRSKTSSPTDVSLFDGEGYPTLDKVWATPSSLLDFDTPPCNAAELYEALGKLAIAP